MHNKASHSEWEVTMMGVFALGALALWTVLVVLVPSLASSTLQTLLSTF